MTAEFGSRWTHNYSPDRLPFKNQTRFTLGKVLQELQVAQTTRIRGCGACATSSQQHRNAERVDEGPSRSPDSRYPTRARASTMEEL